jgi:hypothetical protein
MSDADRKPPRAMLALIALATPVPVPKSTIFYRDNGILSLSFERVDDGLAWGAYLGGEPTSYVRECTRYVGQYGQIIWHGWSVTIDAAEPVTPTDPSGVLTGDEWAALDEIAQGEGVN